jgi:hypothetical protein
MGLPVSGDVIITSRKKSPTVYLLSRYAGPVAVFYGNVDDAVRTAFGFAQERQVDVWLLDDEQSYRLLPEYQLLAEYREKTAEPPPGVGGKATETRDRTAASTRSPIATAPVNENGCR